MSHQTDNDNEIPQRHLRTQWRRHQHNANKPPPPRKSPATGSRHRHRHGVTSPLNLDMTILTYE